MKGRSNRGVGLPGWLGNIIDIMIKSMSLSANRMIARKIPGFIVSKWPHWDTISSLGAAISLDQRSQRWIYCVGGLDMYACFCGLSFLGSWLQQDVQD